MTMVIETLFRRNPQSDFEQLGTPRRYGQAGGWSTPQEYVKECSRRFKHRHPRPYKNGLEMDGKADTIQRVWFEV